MREAGIKVEQTNWIYDEHWEHTDEIKYTVWFQRDNIDYDDLGLFIMNAQKYALLKLISFEELSMYGYAKKKNLESLKAFFMDRQQSKKESRSE